MTIFTFITPNEYKAIENEYRRKNGQSMSGKIRIETLLGCFPDCRKASEEFFNFLKDQDAKRAEYEAKHGPYTYHTPAPLVPEHLEEYSFSAHRTKQILICVEREIGQLMYDDYRWNSPSVQEAYRKSRVAGHDWYKQFADNPDLKNDYLDSLKDRTAYMEEAKKIEQASKEACHEN